MGRAAERGPCAGMMRRALALVPWLLAAVPAVAADWTPRAWTDASTIELCTTRAGEGREERRFNGVRLRPGVVQHSNALALMRAVGLEV